ncbi:MAG: DUF5320 family protein [Bacteroidales bacterium]
MPKLNGSGPDGQGSASGRGLGKCKQLPEEEALKKLGKGAGKRRKSGGGEGKGKRIKTEE